MSFRTQHFLLIAILSLLAVPPPSVRAQSTQVDSLQAALDGSTGLERARLLLDISEQIGVDAFDTAVSHAQESIDLALAGADSSLAVRAYLRLAYHWYGNGDYEPALVAYQNGLELAEQLHDVSSQALFLNEIGTLVKKQGDVDKALEYYEDGLARSQAGNDSTQIANSLNNMGIVYDSRGEFERAMELYEESARMKEALGDLNGVSYNYDNMGVTMARMGRFEESEQYFLRSANIRRELGNERGYGIIMGNLGELMLMKGDSRAALDYLTTAVDIAEATDFHDFRRHVYGVMSNIYKDMGDFERALTEYERMSTLKDSLFNAERSKQLLELQTQYETEKKEQTISLQQAEIAEKHAALQRNYVIIALLVVLSGLLAAMVFLRRFREELRVRNVQMEASIASQESERKRIARDLHDGLGQLISTVRLHVAHGSESAPEAFRKSESALDEMHAEIRNIAFNLMPETLLQKGPAAACEELGGRLEAAGFFSVSVSAFDVERFSEHIEIAVFRIVQEWMNNVSKYANASEVSIQFVQHDDELVVMVEDDGKGFDTSSLGSGSGHGWTNIQSRAQHLGGAVHVDSRMDRDGSTLVVTIPTPRSIAVAA